jgi:hypothetical protein
MAAAFPANDYMHHLGQARAQEWINARLADPTKYRVDPYTNCWIATTGLNSTGYATGKKFTNDQIALQDATRIPPVRNSEMNFLMHRVAYVAEHGRNPDIASHLCNLKSCFNPAHIVDETQSENLRRRFCPPPIICLEHNHVILASTCQHIPRCIKAPPAGINCCLSHYAVPVQPGDDSVMSDVASHASASIKDRLVSTDPVTLAGAEELLLARRLESDAEGELDPDTVEEPSLYPSSPPLLCPAILESSSSPIRGPRRRHPRPLAALSDPAPAPAPASSSGTSDNNAVDTQAFVVPDGTQHIEYETDSGSDSEF